MAGRHLYPADFNKYKLYEMIGEGMSATVYRALCIPLNQIVAIKVVDLEKCHDLDGIRREVQMMSLMNHPNVVRVLCSFTKDYSLYVVMPYIAQGSCLHIMKSYHPQGFEDEPVIAKLLHGTLMALDYLHTNGHIHRDVKAANILLDSNGSVKLADFGISACVFDNDTGDRHQTKNSFAGTPCWMAPEVVGHLTIYFDFSVDIWSFGITALELAQGHPPLSHLPPGKIFTSIVQNAPPSLDYERDRKFSQSFKEMVSACLVKDPKKRPTAAKLLQHNFFKNLRPDHYIASKILKDVPPLGERMKKLKEKEKALAGQNKVAPQQLSQMRINGISAWNFNLEALKMQASLVEDNDEKPTTDMTNLPSTSGLSYEDKYDGVRRLSSESPLISNPIQPLLGINENHQMDIHELQNLSKASQTGFTNSESWNTPSPVAQSVPAASIISDLQLILFHNDAQRAEITSLLSKCVEQSSGNSIESAEDGHSDILQASTTLSAPYGILENRVNSLRESIGKLVTDLQMQRLKNAELEQRLSDLRRSDRT